MATFVLNPANQVTGGRGEQKGLDPWEPPPGCKEEPTDSDDEDGSAPIFFGCHTQSPKAYLVLDTQSAEYTKFHGKISSGSKD